MNAGSPKDLFRYFSRDNFISVLQQDQEWDVVVIGGGASGLGAALDAASRGYRTLLLEQADFSKGTSSRSTKLVHGGVRYLAQGNIGLVKEALYERGLLLHNAPHLVHKQSFVIPCYSWFDKMKYLLGLKLYDWLAGGLTFGPSRFINAKTLASELPELKKEGLLGGVEYWDGQFDDSRLAINLAQTCAEYGGCLINYCRVTSLTKDASGRINGLIAFDLENQQQYTVRAKAVVNATGVFVDEILRMDDAERHALVSPSQGVHLVLDRSFLKGDKAIMIPRTADGRVLFAVPWHNHVVVGTTDTPLDKLSIEPRALPAEIDFILKIAADYLVQPPTATDVLTVFAGLRPLAAPTKATSNTKEISRSHKLLVSPSGLITITGGKWTTYRKMAEDTINQAIRTAGLSPKECRTKDLKIHGFSRPCPQDELGVYRIDEDLIKALALANPQLTEVLHPAFPYTATEVVWAVRAEMARTVEDVLARRLRVLFLDAKAAMAMAPKVARIMAGELNRDEDWVNNQIADFAHLAEGYLIKNQ